MIVLGYNLFAKKKKREKTDQLTESLKTFII